MKWPGMKRPGRFGRWSRLALAMLLALMAGVTPGWRPGAARAADVRETRYTLPRFGTVNVYRPDGAPKGVALFLSGDGGWDRIAAGLARALSDQGLLVAGVSTPTLMHALEQGRGKCINPNYPLVDLARDVQHRMAVRAYMKPIVVGYSAGATAVYGALAQWPNGGYRGVLSMGFSADMPGRKPWCVAPGFHARPIAHPAKGWLFAPSARITVPWIVLQGQDDTVVDPAAAQRFVAAVPGARFILLPKVGHGFAVQARWLPQMQDAVRSLIPPPPAGAISIPDMPLTIVPATRAGNADTMAVIYSGDGGWVGIDRDVAQQLANAGIPVVGIDSLAYFWSARTPGGAAADLNRVIAAYGQRWRRPRVMLVGYSFGADVLPHITRRLDPAIRGRVDSVSLLGLSATADFQFHLSSWLDIDSAQAIPTVPAVTALKGMTIRCVRGAAENDSACPAIPRGIARTYVVPGGHHFDRNAPLLARILLNQSLPASVRVQG